MMRLLKLYDIVILNTFIIPKDGTLGETTGDKILVLQLYNIIYYEVNIKH